MQGCPSHTCSATRSKDKHPPTLRVLSSVKLAPARHRAGPKKAVHCASFLTWTTGIGRGTHEPAPVEAGDSSDVVPNLVVPDEKSGKAFQHAKDLLMSSLCIMKWWMQMLAAVTYLLNDLNASVGRVPKGVEEVKGFKSGSGSTPELATQTTAKPVTIQLTVHATLESIVYLQC